MARRMEPLSFSESSLGSTKEVEMQEVSLVMNMDSTDDSPMTEMRRSGSLGQDVASWISIRPLSCVLLSFFLLASWIEHLITKRKSAATRYGAPRYTCPADVARSKNDMEGNFEYYNSTNADLKFDDNTPWDKYESWNFDAWDVSYSERRSARLDWVMNYYEVKSGSSVYESGCGLGLSLLMTMEILRKKGVENLGLYGNDYLSKSTAHARTILQHLAPDNIETICTADSAQLNFVPSSSFDLAYTGYIDPIVDPLHLSNGDLDAQTAASLDLCTDTTPKGKKLKELAQRAEEDWYASWVSELVRIAKPGAVVAVEEVSEPICKQARDWGGVAKEWWIDAIEIYGWDVDPDSVVVETVPSNNKRYNIAMRRKQD